MAESPESKKELQLERIQRDVEVLPHPAAENHRLLVTTLLLYEASCAEEPCAGKPHAGICERAVG